MDSRTIILQFPLKPLKFQRSLKSYPQVILKNGNLKLDIKKSFVTLATTRSQKSYPQALDSKWTTNGQQQDTNKNVKNVKNDRNNNRAAGRPCGKLKGEKMRAEDYLDSIRKIDLIIQHDIDEILFWKSKAEGLGFSTEGDKVKSSPKQDKMEEAVIKYTMLQEELEQKVIELIEQRKQIKGKLELLPADEYDVLYRRYLLKQDLSTIAVNIFRSESWVWHTQERGLKHLQEILNERN